MILFGPVILNVYWFYNIKDCNIYIDVKVNFKKFKIRTNILFERCQKLIVDRKNKFILVK